MFTEKHFRPLVIKCAMYIVKVRRVSWKGALSKKQESESQERSDLFA